MIRSSRLGLAAACLVVLVLPAYGETTTAPTTEQQAIELLLKQNPALQARRARIDQTRAEATAAGLTPNPALSLYREDLPFAGEQENNLALEQTFQLGDKRARRLAVVREQVAVVEAEYAVSIQETVATFRELLVELAIAEAQIRHRHEALAPLDRVAEIIRKRVAAGDASGYERLRIEAEQASARSRLVELQDRADALTLQVSAYLAQSVPVRLSLTEPDLPTLDAMIAQAEANRAELLLSRRSQALARASLATAQSLSVPDLTASLGLRHVGNSQGHHAGYLASVTLSLPFSDSGQGERARAGASLMLAEREEVALKQTINLTVRERHARLSRAIGTLQAFRRDVLPKMTKIVNVAQAAYQGGETGLLDLLDAYRLAQETRLRELELLGTAKHADIALMQAIGLTPSGRIETRE